MKKLRLDSYLITATGTYAREIGFIKVETFSNGIEERKYLDYSKYNRTNHDNNGLKRPGNYTIIK